jgi:hypothetical protein
MMMTTEALRDLRTVDCEDCARRVRSRRDQGGESAVGYVPARTACISAGGCRPRILDARPDAGDFYQATNNSVSLAWSTSARARLG